MHAQSRLGFRSPVLFPRRVPLLAPLQSMSSTSGSASALTNAIRKAVSQKRIRFRDDRYDLDLTYITKEVIAMGLPASGVHSLYRNNTRDVANMLNQYHPGKYVRLNRIDRIAYCLLYPGFNLKSFSCVCFLACFISGSRLTNLRLVFTSTIFRISLSTPVLRYMIFNLSQKEYDYKLFHNQVMDYGWPDHHAPPLELLFQLCKAMVRSANDNKTTHISYY